MQSCNLEAQPDALGRVGALETRTENTEPELMSHRHDKNCLEDQVADLVFGTQEAKLYHSLTFTSIFIGDYSLRLKRSFCRSRHAVTTLDSLSIT